MVGEIDRDTLRQAGYREGDIYTQLQIGTGTSVGVNFTNTTYQTKPTALSEPILPEAIAPAGAQLKARAIYEVITVGTGESVSVRIQGHGQSYAEITGITSDGTADSGWVDFSPDDRTKVDNHTLNAKTDTGSNTCTVRELSVIFGYEL